MSTDKTSIELRCAGRALARHGLAHAYGHCSVRLDTNRFLVSPSKPLGLVGAGEPGTIVQIDAPLPDGVLGEVRIHREIYKRRPHINAVTRSMPPKTMSLSTLGRTPRARHGFGCYFYPGAPLWDDPQLIRTEDAAEALADLMGDAKALVMRGNGVVTAGESIQEAVVLAWYLEDAARVELDCLAIQDQREHKLISAEEAAKRATYAGRILDRMWDYLTHGDIELGT